MAHPAGDSTSYQPSMSHRGRPPARSGRPARVVILIAALGLATIVGLHCQLVDPVGALDRGAPDTGKASGVLCVTTRCPLPQECCYDPDAGTGQCKEAGACVGAGLYAYRCSDHADCVALGLPGDVCCASYGVKVLIGSTCLAECSDVVLCDPMAPGECEGEGEGDAACGGLGAGGTPLGYSYCPGG
jgi:hypothetical protein